MNLEGVDKAGIWSLMHWSNKRVVLTCSSHRKNMACGTTCRWVKSSGTAELQLHELMQSKWSLHGFSNLQTKKMYTTASGASTWSLQSGTPGTAMPSSSGIDGQQEKEPTCSHWQSNISIWKLPRFCQEDNHNPLPQQLLSQIKNYRFKSNSQDTFNRGYTTQETLTQRKLCKQHFGKKDRSSNIISYQSH